MKLDELKSCPFCGGEASAKGMGGNNVGCNDAECPGYTTNCSTITWNRRATLPADDGLIEKLEKSSYHKPGSNTRGLDLDEVIKLIRQHQSIQTPPVCNDSGKDVNEPPEHQSDEGKDV